MRPPDALTDGPPFGLFCSGDPAAGRELTHINHSNPNCRLLARYERLNVNFVLVRVS
jgi:hypothetical protein